VQGSSERIHPVGWRFAAPIAYDTWNAFRIKTAMEPHRPAVPTVTGVYFPLISLIIPRWIQIAMSKHPEASAQTRTFLYLGT